MAIGPLPDALPDGLPNGRPNAVEPGFHCVRAHWIRGFMAFQLARRVRTVVLEIREWLLGVWRLQPAVHFQHGPGEVGTGG